jgi:hypothetical protein
LFCILRNGDTMGERIGRIGRIRTDFSGHSVGIFYGFQAHAPQKKSVCIRPIRLIRSPIVSQFPKNGNKDSQLQTHSALSPIQLGKCFARKRGAERAKFDF